MNVTTTAPTLRYECPDGWLVDHTVEAWGVVRAAELVDGFIPNVVFVVLRVSAEHSLESLGQVVSDEMATRFENYAIRNERPTEQSLDRAVVFHADNREIVQWQRMFLIPSQGAGVNWFIQAQATTLLSHESAASPAFDTVLSSLRASVE
jgi:hypothetical protein